MDPYIDRAHNYGNSQNSPPSCTLCRSASEDHSIMNFKVMLLETSRGLTVLSAEPADVMVWRAVVMVLQAPVGHVILVAALTVIVLFALDQVFLQPKTSGEVAATTSAYVVARRVVVMLLKAFGGIEIPIAALAVIMFITLNKVLFQSINGGKVSLAASTYVVLR